MSQKLVLAVVQRWPAHAELVSHRSFDKLFNEHWGERVRKARLNERTVIELRNPLLTPETPSNRRELWYGVRR